MAAKNCGMININIKRIYNEQLVKLVEFINHTCVTFPYFIRVLKSLRMKEHVCK